MMCLGEQQVGGGHQCIGLSLQDGVLAQPPVDGSARRPPDAPPLIVAQVVICSV